MTLEMIFLRRENNLIFFSILHTGSQVEAATTSRFAKDSSEGNEREFLFCTATTFRTCGTVF